MRAIICILIALSLATADLSALVNSQIANYDSCWVVNTPNANNRLVLFWTVDATNNKLSAAVSVTGSGYIGFGWSHDTTYGAMCLGDAIVGYMDTGNPQVYDYNLGAYQGCFGGNGVCMDSVAGGVNNIENATMMVNGTTRTMIFTRPLDTGDSNDVVLTNADLWTLWSLGASNDVSIQHTSMDNFKFNLFSPQACPAVSGVTCSNHGTCVKGCCFCNVGYSGPDCSVAASNTSTTTLGPQIIPSEYTFHQQINSKFDVYWKILGDIIEIAVDVEGTGWLAFGPSSKGNMVDSDVIIAWVDDTTGEITISDTYITAQSGSCPGVCKDTAIGGVNDIIDFNGNQNNGHTQIKWLRKLNTGDEKDIAIINGDMPVVWGYHPTADGLVQHTSKGTLKINFFSGTAKATTDLRVIHGILMFIAWSIFVPGTSFIARYLKKFSWWFNVHRWVNSVMMLAVLVAFGLAVSFTTNHFKSVHAIFGLIVTIGAVIQPILGVVADRMYDKGRTEVPWFPDRVHWIIGWAILTLALVNVELGLVANGSSQGLVIAYGVWCALVGTFLLVWFIYKKITGGDDSH